MFELVSTVHAMSPGASGGAEGGGSVLVQFIPLILIFLIFWFLIIRPQQRRAKQHRELVRSVKKGDQIYTDSGIRGTIQRVGDDEITVEIAPKVQVRMQRSRVASMVKEGKGGDDKPAKGKDKARDEEADGQDDAEEADTQQKQG